ncbi:unnamed protein product [Rhizoctonia solani]|uniref:Transmembrane protein n=1 Tax=Rhizoctonia solani TaxID=456999 RepID=A0A8H2X1W5_9AGAM|nr:unnamed protein product [Rhizoctonia solani]
MTRLNIPLFVALAASLLSAVPVDGRDTLPHQRMIRKRGPPVAGPGIGAAAVIGLRVRQATDLLPTASSSSSSAAETSSTAAAAPTTSTTTSASSTSAAPTTTTATPTTTSSAVETTSSSSSTTAVQTTTTTSGGLLDPLTSLLGLSSSTSTTSSAPTTTSTSSTSSVVPPTTTTQQQAPQTTQQAPPPETTPTLNLATSSTPTATRGPSVTQVTVTSISPQESAAAASQSAAAKQRTEKITKNTIISLVVIAACIGGAMAIWTVIRKWKLSPSEKFDDRMQPIDWTPPPANGVTEEAIEEKSKHRRVASGASHGSFTSGGVPQSDQGHGTKAGMYTDSQHSHGYASQDLPPPHDFTAGTVQPGGYGQYYAGQQYAGGPGYADLQRGPSVSESTYSHGANVSRGLSYSRGHGAYDSQSGAIPPMPNPYGGEYGYEDYTHPPAGQAPQAQGQAPYRAF